MSRGKSGPDQIVGAALGLFAERGVHATSLQMIADRLGVTKAAVYYHFKSKQEIVAAALQPAMDGLRELVAAAKQQGDPAERLQTVVRGLARDAIKFRTVYSVVLRDIAAIEAVSSADESMKELHSLLLAGREDALSHVRVAMFLAGLVAPAIDEHVQQLTDAEIEAAILRGGMELGDSL